MIINKNSLSLLFAILYSTQLAGMNNDQLKKTDLGFEMQNFMERTIIARNYSVGYCEFKETQLYFIENPENSIPLFTQGPLLKNQGCCVTWAAKYLDTTYPDLTDVIARKKYPPFSYSGDGFTPIFKFIDEFMIETDYPSENDIVIYYEWKNTRLGPLHVGIMHSENTVKSCWGWEGKGICLHRVEQVPIIYGRYVKFYTLKSWDEITAILNE